MPMETINPSIEVLRKGLLQLRRGQVERLSELSLIPATTIWKLRGGHVTNPTINTFSALTKHLPAALEDTSRRVSRSTPKPAGGDV